MSEGVLDERAGQELDAGALATRALEVLEANWLGHGDGQSRLYPHQWSWDSACIAMATPAGTRVGRSASSARSSRASGRTASCRTSSSLRAAAATSRGRSSGSPGGPPTLRRVWTPRASQPPIHATAALRLYELSESASRRSRSWKSSRRSSARGTRTSTASGRGATTGSSRSGTPGSPAWTTRRSGTRRSDGINPTADEIPTTSASTSSSRTRLSVRRTVNTTVRLPRRALPRARLPTRPDSGRDPVRTSVGALQLASRPVEPRPGADPRGCSATTRPRGLGSADRRRHRRAVERGGRALRRLRPRSGEARRRPDRGRSVSAPRRDSHGRASAADGRQARRVPRRGQRRESWAVTSSPDDPGFLLARYWRGLIWPILNWALQRGLDR